MRKILLTILVGLTAAPALADDRAQQRTARFPAARSGKGYKVLRYTLKNTTPATDKVWNAPFVPLKVRGATSRRYSAKLRPNRIEMEYQFQQRNSRIFRHLTLPHCPTWDHNNGFFGKS